MIINSKIKKYIIVFIKLYVLIFIETSFFYSINNKISLMHKYKILEKNKLLS